MAGASAPLPALHSAFLTALGDALKLAKGAEQLGLDTLASKELASKASALEPAPGKALSTAVLNTIRDYYPEFTVKNKAAKLTYKAYFTDVVLPALVVPTPSSGGEDNGLTPEGGDEGAGEEEEDDDEPLSSVEGADQGEAYYTPAPKKKQPRTVAAARADRDQARLLADALNGINGQLKAMRKDFTGKLEGMERRLTALENKKAAARTGGGPYDLTGDDDDDDACQPADAYRDLASAREAIRLAQGMGQARTGGPPPAVPPSPSPPAGPPAPGRQAPFMGGGGFGLWGAGRFPDWSKFPGDASELFEKALPLHGSVTNFVREEGKRLYDAEHNQEFLMTYARAIDYFLQYYGIEWALRDPGVEHLAQAIGALEAYDKHNNDWRIGRKYFDGTSLGSKRGRENISHATKDLKDNASAIKHLDDPTAAHAKTPAARPNKAGGAQN